MLRDCEGFRLAELKQRVGIMAAAHKFHTMLQLCELASVSIARPP
jgi:hypothetical protein